VRSKVLAGECPFVNEVAAKIAREHNIPYIRAHELATEAALRLTPTTLGQIPEQLETVKAAVSPWLWVFSLVGFGMAVLNTKRIAKMYRGWRRKS
jgi:hypothetical protein